MSEWQPIESAPKDGSVIVARGSQAHKAVGYSIIFWDQWENEWAGYNANHEKMLVKFPPVEFVVLPK